MDDSDTGHTFRIAIELRGTSKVVGDAHHHDGDAYYPLQVVEVRAWSLRNALVKAAELPLSAWFPEEDS